MLNTRDSVFDKYFASFSSRDLKESQTIQRDLVRYSVFKTEELYESIQKRNADIVEQLKKTLDYSKRKSQMSNATYTFQTLFKLYYDKNPNQLNIRNTLDKLFKYGTSLSHKHMEAEFAQESNRSLNEAEQFREMKLDTKKRKRAFEKQRQLEEGVIREYGLNTKVDKNKIVEQYKLNRNTKLGRELDKANFENIKKDIGDIIFNNNNPVQIGQLRDEELNKLKENYTDTSTSKPHKKNPVYEKVRRLVVTEINAAYNIERISTYFDRGIKFVRWNLLPEHTTVPPRPGSDAAIGVVCERCFARANGGLDNLGIYVIEDVITDPELYIPLHPYCGCFYQPIRTRKVGKEAVMLMDDKGNDIVKTTFTRLQDYENYITTFPKAVSNEKALLGSAVGLAALYVFLNKPQIAEELNLENFSSIQRVVTNAIQLDKISNAVKGVVKASDEISTKAVREAIENKDDIIELIKERTTEIYNLQTKLDKQIKAEKNNVLRESGELAPDDGRAALPPLEKRTPLNLEKRGKPLNLESSQRADDDLIPISRPQELIRRQAAAELPTIPLVERKKTFADDIRNAIGGSEMETLQDELGTYFENATRLLNEIQKDPTATHVVAKVEEYKRTINKIETALVEYKTERSRLISNSKREALDNNVDWTMGEVVNLLDEYQVNIQLDTFEKSLKKFKTKSVNESLEKVVGDKSEEFFNNFVKNTFDEIADESTSYYDSVIDRVDKLVKRIDGQLDQDFQFSAYQMRVDNTDLIKELDEAFSTLNNKIGSLNLSKDEFGKLRSYFGEADYDNIAKLNELNKQHKKISKLKQKLFDQQLSLDTTPYYQKVARGIEDETFITPAEKLSITDQKTGLVKQENLVPFLVKRQDKVRDFFNELYTKDITDETKLNNLFQAKRGGRVTKSGKRIEGTKVYANLKTVISQYAERELGLLFKNSPKLISKWENKSIRNNINEFLLDVKNYREHLLKTDTRAAKEQREEMTWWFRQRKQRLQKGEFEAHYPVANFRHNVVVVAPKSRRYSS